MEIPTQYNDIYCTVGQEVSFYDLWREMLWNVLLCFLVVQLEINIKYQNHPWSVFCPSTNGYRIVIFNLKENRCSSFLSTWVLKRVCGERFQISGNSASLTLKACNCYSSETKHCSLHILEQMKRFSRNYGTKKLKKRCRTGDCSENRNMEFVDFGMQTSISFE